MSKMDINNHCGTGRLGKDPELRFTPKGTPVCDCSIAINAGFGRNQKTIWTRLTIWGKQGEFIGTNGKKGDMLMWSGAQFMVEEFDGRDGEKKKTHFFEVGQSGQVNLFGNNSQRSDAQENDAGTSTEGEGKDNW